MTQKSLQTIAAEWHSGQTSALYAYASAGTIQAGLATEIQRCVPAAKPKELTELLRLYEVIKVVRYRTTGGVEGLVEFPVDFPDDQMPDYVQDDIDFKEERQEWRAMGQRLRQQVRRKEKKRGG